MFCCSAFSGLVRPLTVQLSDSPNWILDFNYTRFPAIMWISFSIMTEVEDVLIGPVISIIANRNRSNYYNEICKQLLMVSICLQILMNAPRRVCVRMVGAWTCRDSLNACVAWDSNCILMAKLVSVSTIWWRHRFIAVTSFIIRGDIVDQSEWRHRSITVTSLINRSDVIA